jgi:hypothetical protein
MTPRAGEATGGGGTGTGTRDGHGTGDGATPDAPRPGEVCRALLGALDGSEGRRRRRKRDTTPDAFGMAIKRDLLAAAAADDPDPDQFEAWLLERVLAAGGDAGAVRAMALDILREWQVALAAPSFRHWLEAGAPSDDRRPGSDRGLDPR